MGLWWRHELWVFGGYRQCDGGGMGYGSNSAVAEMWAVGYGSDRVVVETSAVGFWWSWAMRWWQCGDCGLDGLWVLVGLGGHRMGCGLVFRWLWVGVWVARSVVVWCLGVGFFFCCVGGCWGVCGGGMVVVVAGLLER